MEMCDEVGIEQTCPTATILFSTENDRFIMGQWIKKISKFLNEDLN